MPIVRVDMLAGRSAQTKQLIAQEMTQTMARLCKVDPAHIYVMFNDVRHEDWAVGGKVFPNPSAAGAVDAPGSKGGDA